MKKILIGCTLLLIVLLGIYVFSQSKKTVQESLYTTKKVMLGDEVFMLEIADTDPLREKGLSYRSGLEKNTGMLFVFQEPNIYTFWMKDMNFPLDIIWLDQDKKIVHIEHALSPSTYPESFGPKIPTQYVIEVSAGDASRLVLGQSIDI